ncbi:Toll-like receptor Tollo [Mytilus coruscus]|uniref:Toll-like receptor Tollo n=1 Tax=Mytilus coruscus TaxID=42192 RepID=A0A6J8EZH5_MYTCO|nr:Toll-like receptor Tollo [Mytilus coruscus]
MILVFFSGYQCLEQARGDNENTFRIFSNSTNEMTFDMETNDTVATALIQTFPNVKNQTFQNVPRHGNILNITDVSDTATLVFVPFTWRSICSAVVKPTSSYNVTISCFVGKNDTLNFKTFRKFSNNVITFDEKVRFTLLITCEDGGQISLPQFARARLLRSLTVLGCKLFGYFSETKDHTIDLIPDHTENYVLINCQIIFEEQKFNESLNNKNESKTYQCGPTNATAIILRNVTNTFLNPVNIKDFPSEGVRKSALNHHRHQMENYETCKYKHLLYYEKSYAVEMGRFTLLKILQGSNYPSIQVFNFSFGGLIDIPLHFREWRAPYTHLKYVDLTHNKITDIGDIRNHASQTDDSSNGTIDLRYNKIRTVSVKDIGPLMQYDLLTVDIRNNPFDCICEMKEFMEFMKFKFHLVPPKYHYLSNLTCQTPKALHGEKIIELSLEQIGCEIRQTSFLEAPVIILSVFIIVFTVATIFGIRYRKEIVILTYTRFNILLPCRQKGVDIEKKYDAFIAYSEADTTWVVHTLSKRLENPDNPQRFSLCLHHRDFMVGAAISDNIIYSVENSRHTVIIVSKHFLKSEWCRMEFRTALHQSLLEKKRHLIIVLLEDIPTSELEPELKRCMQTMTYVKKDDRWFWDKLVFALSDWSKNLKNKPEIELETGTKPIT